MLGSAVCPQAAVRMVRNTKTSPKLGDLCIDRQEVPRIVHQQCGEPSGQPFGLGEIATVTDQIDSAAEFSDRDDGQVQT